jgi:hypothetical protein
MLRTPVERVRIGRPLQNTQVYVLDANGELCPTGVPGELYIGGDGVTRGYLNRPELTGERFVPDPLLASGRLYRTGDVVRLLADGSLEYLRRNDSQVKLRGYRIELGEIETILRRHPAVRQAVGLVREDRVGDARLVAYVTKNPGVEATDSELRRHLRAFLPDYMLPQHFVELAELPLTPNGKIDTKALPAPFAARLDDSHVEPGTAQECLVAEIWRNALGVSRVSALDNFFTVGGHSLLSLKVIAAIEDRTGVRLNPRVLLLNTLAQVAAHLPVTPEGESGSASSSDPSTASANSWYGPPGSRLVKKIMDKLRGRAGKESSR